MEKLFKAVLTPTIFYPYKKVKVCKGMELESENEDEDFKNNQIIGNTDSKKIIQCLTNENKLTKINIEKAGK